MRPQLQNVETMFENIVTDLLDKGISNSGPLLGPQWRRYDKPLLTFSLESTHGPFFTFGVTDQDISDEIRNIDTLPVLTEGGKKNKRFLFTINNHSWETISAFTLETIPFFTTLTLDVSDPVSHPARTGFLKLADNFSFQCRNLLKEFIKSLYNWPSTSYRSDEPFVIEKSILQKIIKFSQHTLSVVLLDEDGFIIHKEGHAELADELSSTLSRFFSRSNREISRLECADCRAITLTDSEYTIRIGQLTGTSLKLAILVNGPCAIAFTRILHSIASGALTSYAKHNGQLWGIQFVESPKPARIRNWWFKRPVLFPHGKFVGKEGRMSFHTPTCQSLAKSNPVRLHWFESRGSAIENGWRPCNICNP